MLFLELFVQNEPRCRLCGEGILQKWILSAAKAVKSVDKRHLLTVGEEGFYASTKSYVNSANGQVILARILYLIIYLQKLIMHRKAIYGQTTGIYSLCGIENGWKMVV